MKSTHERHRRQIIETGRDMLACSLVVGTWGNISVRLEDEPNAMAITPSGVDYDCIEPADIVLMDFDGAVKEGRLKPSIEHALHGAIYRARPDVGAIVHTHSPHTTAFAIARQPIPAAAEDLVQIVGGDVRVSRYCLPGSPELGEAAVEALAGRNAVILANHGALAAGPTLGETMKMVKVVEKAAQSVLLAQALGGVVELAPQDIRSMREFYLHAYGQR